MIALAVLLAACGSPSETQAPTPTGVAQATVTEGVAQSASATLPAARISTRVPSRLPTHVATGTPGPAPVDTYRVVASYPHDSNAYTQGLVYLDGMLYEGTGLVGFSELRRVELETGAVLQHVPLELSLFGEGVTIVGDRIYQLTWQNGVCLVYDRATFELVDQFEYDTEGWGLTTDGQRLIMSDGSNVITFRDPASFEVLSSIAVHDENGPVLQLNELELIDGEIWANVWLTDRIARIDPATGRVTAWLDLAGLLPADQSGNADVLNGIAWDAAGDRIFVTGKNWPLLFEVEVVRR